jgi:branched-chain amino acid transport system ATP-binding protein
MLALNNVEVVYDGVILVLKGVSLVAREGSITTLLGANGAGKTTTLKAISGLLGAERGQLTKGSVELDGTRLDRLPAHEVVRRGVTQVFEGRRVFENLTVEENLIAGGHVQSDHKLIRDGIEQVYELFAPLAERRHQQAGYLSGGEQQMLAIGRALMSHPRLLLLDEPTLGLAPLIVKQIFTTLQNLNQDGMTILLIEQNANQALKLSEYSYILENGRIALEGKSAVLSVDPTVQRSYLGAI